MHRVMVQIATLVVVVFVAIGCATRNANIPTRASNVQLHGLFTDNMVIQRGRPVEIYGWADPGGRINITLAGEGARSKKRTVIVKDDRTWSVKFPRMKAGGPYTITVSGQTENVLDNVMVGDVWIASGQSNMQWSMNLVNDAPTEIANANYPNIRLFTVPRIPSFEKKDEVESDGWQVCSPETVPEFSAVAYFFGRDVHEALDVPIGLINTSWGGTIAEAWTSEEGLRPWPVFATRLKETVDGLPEAQRVMAEYEQKMTDWNKAIDDFDQGLKEEWYLKDLTAAKWPTMALPGLWEDMGHADFDGFMWFRKEINVPQAWLGRDLTLSLGGVNDRDRVYYNGELIGDMKPGESSANRNYKVPSALVQTDRNVIAVRILDISNKGGISGPADKMYLSRSETEQISLVGDWNYHSGGELSAAPPVPEAPKVRVNNPNVPTVLHNSMIAPLVRFPITGAIWYQGESNASRAEQYKSLFPAMITDWRNKWDHGDFPFFFVQLANFMDAKPEPEEDAWAELREAQRLTLALPKTGMATIIDIGEAKDIHPRNKQDVGNRLALAARHVAYGEKLVYSGPMYEAMKIENGNVRIAFDHVGGGLVSRGGELKGFSIAGEDKKFKWANARIEGDTVIVSSPDVSNPVAVRYGWAANPTCTLYNKEGLPASPFRTDAWPGITAGKE